MCRICSALWWRSEDARDKYTNEGGRQSWNEGIGRNSTKHHATADQQDTETRLAAWNKFGEYATVAAIQHQSRNPTILTNHILVESSRPSSCHAHFGEPAQIQIFPRLIGSSTATETNTLSSYSTLHCSEISSWSWHSGIAGGVASPGAFAGLRVWNCHVSHAE